MRSTIIGRDMSRRALLRHGGMLGAGGLALTSGLLDGKSAFAADGDKLFPATIITTAGSVTLVLDALMKQQGFFREMGVDATTQSVSDGSKVIAAILGAAAPTCVAVRASAVCFRRSARAAR